MDEIDIWLDNKAYEEWLHGTSKPLTDEDKRSLEGLDWSGSSDGTENSTIKIDQWMK